MTTETITWIPVAERLPDADLTVLIHNPEHGEPVWIGWFDGADQWFDSDAACVKVTHWAEMPGGPAA